MIPKIDDDLLNYFESEVQPSFTYKLNEDKTIINYCDGLEAIKQAIYKILNTERYVYAIYSWNYGVELANLYGKPTSYCIPEIERRITEALSIDDRILEVYNFSFSIPKKGIIFTQFYVSTIYGIVEIEKEVNI